MRNRGYLWAGTAGTQTPKVSLSFWSMSLLLFSRREKRYFSQLQSAVKHLSERTSWWACRSVFLIKIKKERNTWSDYLRKIQLRDLKVSLTSLKGQNDLFAADCNSLWCCCRVTAELKKLTSYLRNHQELKQTQLKKGGCFGLGSASTISSIKSILPSVALHLTPAAECRMLPQSLCVIRNLFEQIIGSQHSFPFLPASVEE